MEKLLKISDFARLTGLSRSQLIFYDRKGILHPAHTDEKTGYRYYRPSQMESAFFILLLRDADVPLDEIRISLSRQSGKQIVELLDRQEKAIEQQIEERRCTLQVLRTRKRRAEQNNRMEVNRVEIRNLPEEYLFFGPDFPQLDADERRFPWMCIPDFYALCEEQGIPPGLLLGVCVRAEDIARRQWKQPARFYCHLPGGDYPAAFHQRAGLYVTGTGYTSPDYPDAIYERIFACMESNGLLPDGPAYEEHIRCFPEDDGGCYVAMITVPVRSS